MAKLNRVRVGMSVKCKYPRHGTRNILCNRVGTVLKVGNGPNGKYILLKSEDGTFRTLRRDRMIDAVVVR